MSLAATTTRHSTASRALSPGVGFVDYRNMVPGATTEVTIVIKCGQGVEFVDILAFLPLELGNGKVLECVFGCFARDKNDTFAAK